jgi:aryl-alcohol dehydrogenase-like predicted oxidoreductase
MRRRAFGTTGLQVSELGLGCARIGGIFQRDAGAFITLLERARDEGINFFDTADMYSQGESEALLGRAFRRRRDQVIIASKVGYCLPTQRRLIARVKPLVRPLIRLLRIKRENLPAAVRGEVRQNFSPAYIRTAVEASLRRLRSDYLDLLQLHSVPADVVRRGDWLEALEALQRAGKIRFYGISSDTLESASAALEYPKVASLQVQVSLLEQSFAQAIAPRAKQQNVAIIARECLANGLLVKAEGEIDPKLYWNTPERIEAGLSALAGHREAARAQNKPLARLALEYASGVDAVAVALIGVRSIEQLDATLRAYRG